MTGHVVPQSLYFTVFGALLALLLATVGVAYVDLGALNPIVAISVATAKMVLILLYFMHLRYSTPLARLVVVSGLLWLAILLVFTLSDYFTRTMTPLVPS